MPEATKKLTPYQGKRRSYGKFECPKCDGEWTSGNSWANMGQQCKSCLINVYPSKQWRLKKGKGKKRKKPHLVPLCEKCDQVKQNCVGWSEPRESGCLNVDIYKKVR